MSFVEALQKYKSLMEIKGITDKILRNYPTLTADLNDITFKKNKTANSSRKLTTRIYFSSANLAWISLSVILR
jgi:hypothetical protein